MKMTEREALDKTSEYIDKEKSAQASGSSIKPCPCEKCDGCIGWIKILTVENSWVDRPWCTRFNEVCQPWNHEECN